ncbi:MAG: DUF2255 family protein [Gemmatimonadaceae bacterium]
MIRPRRAAKKTFSDSVIAAIDKAGYLKVRAGTTHRFVAIWSVVVGRRVFVRSWYMRPTGWYFTFLEEPRGAIEVNGREISIRASRVRSLRVKAAVSKAYAAKYVTPASLKYVRGFARGRRRDTTTELMPR